jgi:hypothetical protein
MICEKQSYRWEFPNFTLEFSAEFHLCECVRATARVAAGFVLLERSFAVVTNYVVKYSNLSVPRSSRFTSSTLCYSSVFTVSTDVLRHASTKTSHQYGMLRYCVK